LVRELLNQKLKLRLKMKRSQHLHQDQALVLNVLSPQELARVQLLPREVIVRSLKRAMLMRKRRGKQKKRRRSNWKPRGRKMTVRERKPRTRGRSWREKRRTMLRRKSSLKKKRNADFKMTRKEERPQAAEEARLVMMRMILSLKVYRSELQLVELHKLLLRLAELQPRFQSHNLP
jgi:hypothetical protein